MDDLCLDIHRMHGHCYDGATTMSGIKSGVANLLTDMEPNVMH